LIGRVKDIESKVWKSPPQTPALIVLGEVVGLRSSFIEAANGLSNEFLGTDE
jgi:hypothetical protein